MDSFLILRVNSTKPPIKWYKVWIQFGYLINHDKRVSFISDKGLKKTIFLRFMTILYYLNDVEDGGETAFPVADNETFDQAVRPVSNVVLLPCRTKLIELNSTLARQ